MHRFKRAKSIYTYFEGEDCIVCNFLSKQFFTCNLLGIEILCKSWVYNSINYYLKLLPEFSSESILNQLIKLTEAGALIIEGTEEAQKDEEFEESWEWHISSAAFHFGAKNGYFIPMEDAIRLQEARTLFDPSPELYTTNEAYENVKQMPPVDLSEGVLKVMYDRRTHRSYKRKSISIKQLTTCLFSGLGIIGFYENPNICDLPIKMTPSGGARNPFEAYVYSLNVKGLKKGLYHYSALENSLGFLNSKKKLPEPSILFGNQPWINFASAIIILVANFERTMWKYPDCNAYRVVLIEAGHIGQNIALTATMQGLVGNPTSALNDKVIESQLGIKNLTHAAISAIAIGYPDKTRPS